MAKTYQDMVDAGVELVNNLTAYRHDAQSILSGNVAFTKTGDYITRIDFDTVYALPSLMLCIEDFNAIDKASAMTTTIQRSCGDFELRSLSDAILSCYLQTPIIKFVGKLSYLTEDYMHWFCIGEHFVAYVWDTREVVKAISIEDLSDLTIEEILENIEFVTNDNLAPLCTTTIEPMQALSLASLEARPKISVITKYLRAEFKLSDDIELMNIELSNASISNDKT